MGQVISSSYIFSKMSVQNKTDFFNLYKTLSLDFNKVLNSKVSVCFHDMFKYLDLKTRTVWKPVSRH